MLRPSEGLPIVIERVDRADNIERVLHASPSSHVASPDPQEGFTQSEYDISATGRALT